MRTTQLIIIFFVLTIFSCRNKTELNNEEVKSLSAKYGMVVSASPLASEIGNNILKQGGNAIDAAIAVQFALAVTYPEAGNIGGGGFMVIRLKDGSSFSLDYREKAPMKAFETMYQNPDGSVKKDASLLGYHSCGVPGSVDGMVTAYNKFGTLPWEKLVQPSIDLAENGFAISESEAKNLDRIQKDLKNENSVAPGFLLKNNWKQGDLLVQHDLAKTLKEIRDHKRRGFYEGITAEKIVREMRNGNGLISNEDLENYHSVWREPITGSYRGYKVISMGPPSSGGILLVQLLKMIEKFRPDTLGWNDYRYIHLLCEAEKRAFADRAEYLGDDDFITVPASQLTDSTYLAGRFGDFSFNSITNGITYGRLNMPFESDETTHFSIIDRERNAVAVTTTLNNLYGSKVVVNGSGFFLNDEMDDFSIKPGHLNLFGLPGGTANAIRPGKRMLSSMTPTIIEKNDSLFCVLGSPGGSKIITSVFQTLLNIIDFNMDIDQAIAAGRFHHQGIPDTLYYETNRVKPVAFITLTNLGYNLREIKSTGRVDAILVENNMLNGAGDPRGDDSASGY